MAESTLIWTSTYAGALYRGKTTRTEFGISNIDWFFNDDKGDYYTEVRVYKKPLLHNQMVPSDVPGILM